MEAMREEIAKKRKLLEDKKLIVSIFNNLNQFFFFIMSKNFRMEKKNISKEVIYWQRKLLSTWKNMENDQRKPDQKNQIQKVKTNSLFFKKKS